MKIYIYHIKNPKSKHQQKRYPLHKNTLPCETTLTSNAVQITYLPGNDSSQIPKVKLKPKTILGNTQNHVNIYAQKFVLIKLKSIQKKNKV